MSNEAPNQDLPEEPDPEDPDQPYPDNTLPDEQPPRGPGNNRGRSEDAPGQVKRDEAPGQNK
jgi:hypothetical protein